MYKSKYIYDKIAHSSKSRIFSSHLYNKTENCQITLKNIKNKNIFKEMFHKLEEFEKNTQVHSKLSDKYIDLLGIFDTMKLKESNYDWGSDKNELYFKIWRNFLEQTINNIKILEKEELSIWKIYDDQVEKLSKLQALLENQKTKGYNQDLYYKSEQMKINKILNEKDKLIADLEKTLKELNKKLGVKEKCDTNELYLYTQKQLLRDNNLLTTENKFLRESVSKLEKEIESLKLKEVKIMKILFTLSRKGISINELVEKELSSELKFKEETNSQETGKNKDESISINDSMFSPLYIDNNSKTPNKPEIVPSLNLIDINDSMLQFASEDTTNKEKLIICSNTKVRSDLTDDNIYDMKDEISSEMSSNKNTFSPNRNEIGNFECSKLNAMEKELLKTYKNINKDKNISTNKSTINYSEITSDLKSNSKKNSFNENLKIDMNEVKDNNNISEYDIEKFSINSNYLNIKNMNNIK